MNSKEVIDHINYLREQIAETLDNNDAIVSLLDENGKVLTKGRYGTGSEEYGDFISFSNPLTEEDFNYLTVGHIKIWLATKSFEVYIL